MVDKNELRDRLELGLGYTCRLPRSIAVAQRRRVGVVKVALTITMSILIKLLNIVLVCHWATFILVLSVYIRNTCHGLLPSSNRYRGSNPQPLGLLDDDNNDNLFC